MTGPLISTYETLPRFHNFGVPGLDGEVVSRRGASIERSDIEALKDEYYILRGWNSAGLPSRKKLRELDLEDVSADLDEWNLLG